MSGPSEKGRRIRRIASVIRQVVSEALLTELADPRLAFVTVTGVDIAPDLRFADVRVSILGNARQQRGCMEGIRHSRGHLQQLVAEALKVKFCPILRFHFDESVKRSVEISALIAKARAEDEAARADRIRRGVEEPEDLPERPLGEDARTDEVPGGGMLDELDADFEPEDQEEPEDEP